MKEIMGTGVALCTPFNVDGTIDFGSLEKLVESCIQGGVEYLVALGTTAETATLSDQDKQAVVNSIVQTNAGRLPIVLGIGGNNTELVAKQINQSAYKDFAAILSVAPYYNKPNQEGFYRHYSYLAENTEANIIMYNVPGRTGSNMLPATTLRLAEKHPSLVAIKDAPLDFTQFLELLGNKPKDFLVLSGDDMWALSSVIAGAAGTISVIGQGLPQQFSDMIRLGLKGNAKEAFALQYQLMPFIDLIFKEGNPAGIKGLLKVQGTIKEKGVRLPLSEISETLEKELQTAFQNLSALNKQIKLESESSNLYLSMASWAESNGFEGTAMFLYQHADEERMHMLKLVKFLNERGGKVIIPGTSEPKNDFETVQDLFETLLEHELGVSEQINGLVGLTLSEKDHITNNFLQWFVTEQIEEEKLARTILDKLKLIGDAKSGMYLFDQDIKNMHKAVE
ncbi:unnamed protein product, partial [Cyprideis torosa]